MEVKKITEGMTAPQVAQVIDDNFKGIIGETDAKLSELGSKVNLTSPISSFASERGKIKLDTINNKLSWDSDKYYFKYNSKDNDGVCTRRIESGETDFDLGTDQSMSSSICQLFFDIDTEKFYLKGWNGDYSVVSNSYIYIGSIMYNIYSGELTTSITMPIELNGESVNLSATERRQLRNILASSPIIKKATSIMYGSIKLEFSKYRILVTTTSHSTSGVLFLYHEDGYHKIPSNISKKSLEWNGDKNVIVYYSPTDQDFLLANDINDVPLNAIILEAFYTFGGEVVRSQWTSPFVEKTGFVDVDTHSSFNNPKNERKLVEVIDGLEIITTKVIGKTYIESYDNIKGPTLTSVNVDIKKGEKVNVSFTSSQRLQCVLGVNFTDGNKHYQIANISNDINYEYIAEADLSDIVLWIETEIDIATFTIIAKAGSIAEDVAKNRPLRGRSISILGDSYSTYGGGWNGANDVWYGQNGVDGENAQENDVSSVEDTWWYRLCQETGMVLLRNDSYSGSTICNTGYNGDDTSQYSFIARMKKTLCENVAMDVKPSIIFIFGGTNDSWAGAPLGELKYAEWTAEDLKNVLPAICFLFYSVKKWNPGATVINIVNPGLKEEIIKAFAEASVHYGIHNLALHEIAKENGHPNTSGMAKINAQIKEFLYGFNL